MSAIEAVQAVVGDAIAMNDRLLHDVAPIVLDETAMTAAVAAIVTEELAARHALFGAGFVVAPERFGRPFMSWWQALGADRVVRRLDAGATGAGTVRSYERLEWYAIPKATGRGHMTGPYVDLLCTDEATLTFTAPMIVDGDLAGVVGADVTVRAFEHAVTDALLATADGALVVTDEGRVAASTDPGVPVQRRLRDDALARYVVEPVPGTPLSIAVPR